MATIIKLKRALATRWTSQNPVLAAGEVGLETDTRKVKYGDGTTAWTSLPYGKAEADLTDASTTAKGVIQIATDAEVTSGTVTTKAVTPAQLSGKQSTSAKGTANGYAGLDGTSKVAATNLPDASSTAKGIIQIATDAEATTGTDTSKAVTAKQLKTATTITEIDGGTV